MSKNKTHKDERFVSSFFLKLFFVPTIIWFIISLIAMISDGTDSDSLTFTDLIIADTVIILIWFIVSFVISLIINESRKKTKVIKEVYYINENEKNMDKNTQNVLMKEAKQFNNQKIRIFMIILFILTILSIYAAGFTVALTLFVKNPHGFTFTKYLSIFWCFLPIPILSIILGFKYKKAGLKCLKNIIAGFIVAFLLLIYGAFCLIPNFSEDYSKINEYKEIVGVRLPEKGELEIQDWGNSFDDDKTLYTEINVYYDKENVFDLESDIEKSNNWFLSSDIKSDLKLIIPSSFRSNYDVYYSIYNKTLDEYNNVIKIPGEYDIYAMRYDKSNKELQIHKYRYLYK